MKQYDIWWAELPPPAGRRPVLVLTRTAACRYLNKVMVAEITTTVRGIAQEVALGPDEGLPAACVANFDNVQTIAKPLLVLQVGRLAAGRYREVKRALGHALDWAEIAEIEALGGRGASKA